MQKLARLSYLSPEDEKLEVLAKDVGKILRFVEHIQEVDTVPRSRFFSPPFNEL